MSWWGGAHTPKASQSMGLSVLLSPNLTLKQTPEHCVSNKGVALTCFQFLHSAQLILRSTCWSVILRRRTILSSSGTSPLFLPSRETARGRLWCRQRFVCSRGLFLFYRILLADASRRSRYSSSRLLHNVFILINSTIYTLLGTTLENI